MSALRRSVLQERFLWGLLGVVSILAAWEGLRRAGIGSDVLFSSPTHVWRAARSELASGRMWSEIWATVHVWWLGFALGASVGVIIGVLSGVSRWVRCMADPWLRVWYSIPELALIPLLIVWFGLGSGFRVCVVVLSSVFYVAVNTLAGVRAIEQRYYDVAWIYEARPLRVFRTVILPGAFPYVLTGLRQGASRGLVGAVVAEFIAANNGIGFMITTAGSTLDTARLMYGITILALFGIISGELLRRIERRFDGWRAR